MKIVAAIVVLLVVSALAAIFIGNLIRSMGDD